MVRYEHWHFKKWPSRPTVAMIPDTVKRTSHKGAWNNTMVHHILCNLNRWSPKQYLHPQATLWKRFWIPTYCLWERDKLLCSSWTHTTLYLPCNHRGSICYEMRWDEHIRVNVCTSYAKQKVTRKAFYLRNSASTEQVILHVFLPVLTIVYWVHL